MRAPGPLALALATLVGRLVRDVLITPDELRGLTTDLLVSAAPLAGTTSFRGWLEEHAADLGRVSSSELGRHHRR